MILEGKVAIVTGAGRGVGRGVALALAMEGAAVAIPEINFEDATAVANEIKDFGGKALAITCDVGKREAVNTVITSYSIHYTKLYERKFISATSMVICSA